MLSATERTYRFYVYAKLWGGFLYVIWVHVQIPIVSTLCAGAYHVSFVTRSDKHKRYYVTDGVCVARDSSGVQLYFKNLTISDFLNPSKCQRNLGVGVCGECWLKNGAATSYWLHVTGKIILKWNKHAAKFSSSITCAKCRKPDFFPMVTDLTSATTSGIGDNIDMRVLLIALDVESLPFSS